jgi:hypothetical protein
VVEKYHLPSLRPTELYQPCNISFAEESEYYQFACFTKIVSW